MYKYDEKTMCFFRGGAFKNIYLEILMHKVPSYFNRGIVIRNILLDQGVSLQECFISVQ